jgi:hypothetical protein
MPPLPQGNIILAPIGEGKPKKPLHGRAMVLEQMMRTSIALASVGRMARGPAFHGDRDVARRCLLSCPPCGPGTTALDETPVFAVSAIV